MRFNSYYKKMTAESQTVMKTPKKATEAVPNLEPDATEEVVPFRRQVRRERTAPGQLRVLRNCPGCSGTGQQLRHFADTALQFSCEICSETGLVEFFVERYEVLRRCTSCGGRGCDKVIKHQPCSWCGGVGLDILDRRAFDQD